MKNEMKTHRLKPWFFGAILTPLALAFWSVANAAPVTVFQEGYESDGSGTRYIVENPSDDGSKDYFARRREEPSAVHLTLNMNRKSKKSTKIVIFLSNLNIICF